MENKPVNFHNIPKYRLEGEMIILQLRYNSSVKIETSCFVALTPVELATYILSNDQIPDCDMFFRS